MGSKAKNDKRYVRQYGGNGDDYSTGTATVVGSAGAIPGYTAVTRYKRIGNQVHYHFDITFNSIGANTYPAITDLPFPAVVTTAAGVAREIAVNGHIWTCTVTGGTSQLNLTKYDNSGVIANGHRMVGTIVYETNDT